MTSELCSARELQLAVGVGQCMAVLGHLTPNGLFVRRPPRMTHPQVVEFPLNLIYKQWLFDATVGSHNRVRIPAVGRRSTTQI